jgi:hypothetical protein
MDKASFFLKKHIFSIYYHEVIMDGSFSSKVQTVVDDQDFGLIRLKWSVATISRDYGYASLSPYIPDQTLDLSSGLQKYLDNMADDLEFMEENKKTNNGVLEFYEQESLDRYNRLKNLSNLEIKEFKVEIKTEAYGGSSIGLHVVKMEIDSINQVATVHFSGDSA